MESTKTTKRSTVKKTVKAKKSENSINAKPSSRSEEVKSELLSFLEFIEHTLENELENMKEKRRIGRAQFWKGVLLGTIVWGVIFIGVFQSLLSKLS